jgi:hypothetical protein
MSKRSLLICEASISHEISKAPLAWIDKDVEFCNNAAVIKTYMIRISIQGLLSITIGLYITRCEASIKLPSRIPRIALDPNRP